MRPLLFVWAWLCAGALLSQSLVQRLDSLRAANGLPRLAFLVTSGDSIHALQVLGPHADGTPADASDRFQLGSNTKAITALLAEQLMSDGKLALNTGFFTLFPELKAGARKDYLDLTLGDLLTFRGRVAAYTYTDDRPRLKELHGGPAEQRLQLIRYFLKRPPAPEVGGLTMSNLDYVMVGAMLERASGKPYAQLLSELAARFGADLRVGPVDSTALQEAIVRKMDRLQSAGNVRTDLQGYARLLQELLHGQQQRGFLLPPAAYERMLRGTPVFAEGWFHTDGLPATNAALTAIWGEGRFGLHADAPCEPFAFNQGSAAGYSSQVRIYGGRNRAYAVFADRSSPRVSQALDAAMVLLLDAYR